jgi:hypothetical protein
MAPSGDVAYVTFKAGKGQKKKEPIRIGQGYPINKKGSWSSPDYVIRVSSFFIVLKEGFTVSNNSHTLPAFLRQSVSNFGVPYKFTVPALAKYRM